MQEKTTSVYGLYDEHSINLPDNGIFYIGSSIDPQRRFVQHMSQFNQESNRAKIDRVLSIRKDGFEPGLLIIEEDIQIQESSNRERYWIEYYLRLGAQLTNQAITVPGMGMADREELTVEVVKSALPGLHFLHMDTDDGYAACLNCYDAAKLLSWIQRRPINYKSFSGPVKSGKLHPYRIAGINAYPFYELITLVIQESRGRP